MILPFLLHKFPFPFLAFKAVLGHAGGKKIKEEFEEEVGSLDPVTLGTLRLTRVVFSSRAGVWT